MGCQIYLKIKPAIWWSTVIGQNIVIMSLYRAKACFITVVYEACHKCLKFLVEYRWMGAELQPDINTYSETWEHYGDVCANTPA